MRRPLLSAWLGLAAVLGASADAGAETLEGSALDLSSILIEVQETARETLSIARSAFPASYPGLSIPLKIDICCANVLANFLGSAPPPILFLPVHCWISAKNAATGKVILTSEAFPKWKEVHDPATGKTTTKGPFVWPEITRREGGSCVTCSSCTAPVEPAMENEAYRAFISQHGGRDLVEMRQRLIPPRRADEEYQRTLERIRQRQCISSSEISQGKASEEKFMSRDISLGRQTEERMAHEAHRVFASEHGGLDIVEMRQRLNPPRRADEDYRRVLERLRRRETDNAREQAYLKAADDMLSRTSLDYQCVKQATQDWTIGQYYLAGPNSNTFPRYVADRCCARKAGPTGFAPGWDSAVP